MVHWLMSVLFSLICFVLVRFIGRFAFFYHFRYFGLLIGYVLGSVRFRRLLLGTAGLIWFTGSLIWVWLGLV